MKKIFILASVVIIAMTSCKKDEVIVNNSLNNEIGFSTFTHKTTKATPTTDSNIKNANIKVYSYLVNGTAAGEAITAVDYFKAHVVNNAGTWQSDTVRYWPATALTVSGTQRLSFFAFHPSGATLTWNGAAYKAKTTVKPSFTFAVPVVASQIDLLVASKEDLHKESNSGAVALAFTHALSQVNFSAKGQQGDGVKYTVSKVVIGDKTTGDLKNSGTYTYGTGWSNQSGTAKYEYPLQDNSVVIDGLTVKALGLTAGTGALMLLPQSGTSNVQISVTYKAELGSDVLFDGTKAFTINSLTWAAATKYNYVITLPAGSDLITYTVTITDWTTNTDTPVTVS